MNDVSLGVRLTIEDVFPSDILPHDFIKDEKENFRRDLVSIINKQAIPRVELGDGTTLDKWIRTTKDSCNNDPHIKIEKVESSGCSFIHDAPKKHWWNKETPGRYLFMGEATILCSDLVFCPGAVILKAGDSLSKKIAGEVVNSFEGRFSALMEQATEEKIKRIANEKDS